MELRQLRYFCRSCDLGSFTAAASELFVTEQTVSYAIKKLEGELGCAILVRGKHGVAPTETGAEVLEKARSIVSQADELIDSARTKPAARGLVRFFVTTMGIPEADGFSIDALDLFAAQYPGIEVNISEAPSQKCTRAVLGGHADIALVYSRPEDPELEAHLLMEGGVALAFCEDHPLAAKELVSFADLRGESVLWATDTGYGFQVMNERCRQYGFEPALRTVPSSSYLDSAAAGKGVAMALATHPKLTTKAGLTARRLVPEDDFTIPICLVVSTDCPAESPARILLDWLLQKWGGAEAAARL